MVANKLLLPRTDGQPIIRHVAAKYADASLAALIVVTGRDADALRRSLRGLTLSFAHNPDYATGEMLSSLKVGLRALPADVAGALIQPGDMPCLPGDIMARLLAAHEPGWDVAPVYRGRRGHPLLLDRAHWGDMLGLAGGARPRDGLRRERMTLLEVGDAGVTLDVDTRGGL